MNRKRRSLLPAMAFVVLSVLQSVAITAISTGSGAATKTIPASHTYKRRYHTYPFQTLYAGLWRKKGTERQGIYSTLAGAGTREERHCQE